MSTVEFSPYCDLVAQVVRQIKFMHISEWGTTPDPENAWPYAAYINDVLFYGDHRNVSSLIFSPRMRVKDVLGLPKGVIESDRAHQFRTSKPFEFVWDGKSDYERYGSLLTQLKSLSHGVASSDTAKHASRREKGVEHVAHNGNLQSSDLSRQYVRSMTGQPDLHASIILYPYVRNFGSEQPDKQAMRVRQYVDGNLAFWPEAHPAGGSFAPGTELLERVNTIATVIDLLGGSITISVNGFDYTYSQVVNKSRCDESTMFNTSINVSYRYTMHNVYGHEVVYDVHIDDWYSWVPDGTYHGWESTGPLVNEAIRPINEEVLKISSHGSVTYVSSNYSGFIPLVPVMHGDAALSRNIAFARVPTDSSYVGYESDFETFRNTVVPKGAGPWADWADNLWFDPNFVPPTRLSYSKESYIRSRFHLDLPDLRPSSFLAASDALDNLKGVLDANWLQNAQHLTDIVNILPDTQELARILAKINDGDSSVLVDLVDYLTDSILKWNFHQKPLIRDGKEILSKDLLKAVRDLSLPKTYTIYGKFEYVFDEKDCYISRHQVLVTRAKIRVRLDLGTLMTSLLAADSLGFLPTLSRLWSLVPFSFVVDWFFNMSKRLKQVDNQIAWLGFATEWCTYSYKVHCYPNVGELGYYHLVDTSDLSPFSNYAPKQGYWEEKVKPFTFTAYRREFSMIMPRLTDSRFDFLKQTQQPNVWTVGSLLWKLV